MSVTASKTRFHALTLLTVSLGLGAVMSLLWPVVQIFAAMIWPRPGFYLERLPPAFEVEKVVAVDHLLGNCAMAVFRYTGATQRRLQEGGGLDWLAGTPDAKIGREVRRTYGHWQVTPQPLVPMTSHAAHRWRYGLSCLREGRHAALNRSVLQALDRPGSYYTAEGKVGLVVVPAQRLVVYLADGS